MIQYKTYDEQIEILKNRGMTIDDEQRAKDILKQNNYYNLINGYKDIFIDTTQAHEAFINGVSFSEIYALHQFDKELRLSLSHILIIVERTFASVFAHEFSKSFPNHDADFLDINNYNTTTKFDKDKNTLVLLSSQIVTKLNNMLTEATDHNDPMICHYKGQYGRVPLWVFVNKLSFGTLAKMYSILLPREKHAIAKSIGEIANQTLYPNDIQQALNVLVLLRNKCAHDQRIYDFNPSPMTIKANSFTKKYFSNTINIHTLFGALGCISLFVKPDVFNAFITKIHNHLDQLFDHIHSIPTRLILIKMGIPQTFLAEGDD